MIRNYIKLALRNFRRSPLYASINITGLALGMTCVILMILFVKNELSYDSFHDKGSQIFRLNTTVTETDGQKRTGGSTGQVQGPAFKESIPEITDYVRFWDMGLNVIAGQQAMHQQGLFADSSFFRIFSFPMLHGDAANALTNPYSIVVTENTALKYFGTTDVVGKILTVEEQGFQPMTITAVTKALPDNSSIKFDVILTFQFMQTFFKDEFWLNQYLTTFVTLHPGADRRQVEKKFDAIFKSRAGEQLTDPVKADGFSTQLAFSLQPLADIHLGNAEVPNGSGILDSSSHTLMWILCGIAAFILLMACINFVNLTIAHSLKRAKEIGIRKINGSHTRQIIGMFLVEAAILCMIAFFLAIFFSSISLPLFNSLVNRHLEFDVFVEKEILLAWIAVIFISILLAGLYPSWLLSKFNAVEVLYSKQKLVGKHWLGKGLVIFQFTLAITLITVSIIYYLQMNFMLKKDPGYDPTGVVLIQLPPQRDPDHLVRLFRSELAAEPAIKIVGGGNSMPGQGSWGSSGPLWVNGKPVESHMVRADEYFLPVLGIPIVDGRNFSRAFSTDSIQAVIVNQAFVRSASLSKPVGTAVKLPNEWEGEIKATIVGVVKDYHHHSMKDKIGPMIFVMKHYETLMVKVQANKTVAALSTLEKTYKKHLANSPFQFSFLKDTVRNQYSEERYWQHVIGYSTALSVFICCLGLFGLSSLAALRRTREVGIRKVLGATVAAITRLLTRDFLKLVFIAFCIATPAAWLLMNRWLENFAYRINIHWWIFLFSGSLVFLLAFVTTSFHAIKAAIVNPAKILRSE